MSLFFNTRLSLASALFVSAALVSGCSSSDDNGSLPASIATGTATESSNVGLDDGATSVTDASSVDASDVDTNSDEATVITDDGAVTPSADTNTPDSVDAGPTDTAQNDAGANTTDATDAAQADAGSNTTDSDDAVSDGTEAELTETDNAVPDPMVQNSTAVDFQITVPAYMSNALQVRVAWADEQTTAQWAGDEQWTAALDLPTDTENDLVITFADDNGAITLGTHEQLFRTGTNDAEVYTVSADQFDTASWDDDGDGVSNLDGLLAGANLSDAPRILLFSETRSFRHPSIETALDALQELAATENIATDLAGDSEGVFTSDNLAQYSAVVWVSTSGDVLNGAEQEAFEQYIRSGGGYAGIHAATDTEYDWPWYGDLVGAYFARHPLIQSATQSVEDSSHPSTAHLDLRWTRVDEWYDFSRNPRANVNVLLSLDESTYTGGGMGEDHPSAWYHEFDGGRSWYTGGGHTPESYSEPNFRTHLIGGIRYAAGIDG